MSIDLVGFDVSRLIFGYLNKDVYSIAHSCKTFQGWVVQDILRGSVFDLNNYYIYGCRIGWLWLVKRIEMETIFSVGFEKDLKTLNIGLEYGIRERRCVQSPVSKESIGL